MSPDINWRVGEDTEQETIVASTSTRRSRRSWLVVLLVVIFGVGLGITYRSIPEPEAHPTLTPTVRPTPTRPAIPAKLFETIDREAQALADGDFEAYLDTRPQATSDEIEAQRQNFTAWGRPKDDHPVYTLVDFNLLTATSAWADIRQFRAGRYFRETRFYYRMGDRWLRTSSPNFSLWSGQEESLQTPHFNVTYAVEDRDVISPTLRQLEEDYQALCHDLGCASIGYEPTFTLKIQGVDRSYAYPVLTGEGTILLPSPRVTGFFESGRAYSWKNNFAHSVLLQAIVERVLGDFRFDRPGGGILWAASIWALDRIDPLPAEFHILPGDLKQKPLLSLEVLWEIGGIGEPGLMLAYLNQLLRFVEQEYGATAITQLLGAIDSAKSLPEAIENGLGVPFAEFEQKWQTWAKAHVTEQ
jgi:hypothetical protein